jgi:uncharacterized protein (TIGR02284 family)
MHPGEWSSSDGADFGIFLLFPKGHSGQRIKVMTTNTKTALRAETVLALQDLIQVNIDSRDGFNDAAEHVEDVTLAAIFQELSSQRNDQISELRTLVAANAEEPNASGSAAAAVHRGWMDLRAALGGGAAAILSEAERGEDHIKGKYEDALKNEETMGVRDVLSRQYAAVKLAHDRIRDLRDEYQKD